MALSYKNDEQQDERLSPYSDTARHFDEWEKELAGDSKNESQSDNTTKSDSQNNTDNVDKIRAAEDNPNAMNYTGDGSSNTKQKFSGKGFFKKKGPLALLITIFLGGGLGLGTFFAVPAY